jgi:hypothetical protein
MNAFSNCAKLEKIEIPRSVERIWGFSECFNLREIKIESGSHLMSIDGFCGCSKIERIEIRSSVEYAYGFYACQSLREVVLPTNGRLRHVFGFWNCPSLELLELPESVESILGLKSEKVIIVDRHDRWLAHNRRKIQLATSGAERSVKYTSDLDKSQFCELPVLLGGD